jgi:hypothetical protein
MKAQMGTFRDLIPTDLPSLGSPWLLSGAASLYGRSRMAHRLRVANVVISNVPGPQVPLYLAGARMSGMYPLSIVVHGVALNITVQSYMGQLCFGLITCRRAAPDVRELAVQLQSAMEALRRLAPAPDPAGRAAIAPEARAIAAEAIAAASAGAKRRVRRAKPIEAATATAAAEVGKADAAPASPAAPRRPRARRATASSARRASSTRASSASSPRRR